MGVFMKQVLQRMAEYNTKAGEAMLAIVAKAPAGLAAKNVGVYFKSIDGTIEHMAWAIVLWLKRFAGFGSYPCLASSALVSRPLDETKAEITGDAARTAALLIEASSLLERFIVELPESEMERRVSYRTTDGKEQNRTLWHAIFQVLGHGTHHRGEISAILDQNGVANDYNGFILYMP